MGGAKKNKSEPVKYYATMEQVICMSPVDAIVEIEINSEKAYTRPITQNGEFYIDKPELFGGDNSEGGVQGWCEARFGQPWQNKSSFLAEKVSQVLSATRGVLSVVAKNFYLGNNPYAKAWNFRVKSTLKNYDYSDMWYKEKATIAYGYSGVEGSVLQKEDNSSEKYWHITSNRNNDVLYGFQTNASVTPLILKFSESAECFNYRASNFSIKDTRKITNQKMIYEVVGYPHPDDTPAKIIFPISSSQYYDRNKYVSDDYLNDLTKHATNSFSIPLGGCPWASYNNGKWIVKVPTSATNISYVFNAGVRRIEQGGHYGSTVIYIPIDGTIATESSNYRMVFTDGIVVYTGKRTNTSNFVIEGYTVPDNSTTKQNTHGHTLTTGRSCFATTDTIYAFGCDSEYARTYILIKDENNKYKIRIIDSDTFEIIETININPQGTFVQDDCYFLLTKTYMVCVCGTDIISMKRNIEISGNYDDSQLDYNPAHAIREAITSKVWGLGKDETVIDDDNFKAAADTLYEEKIGISFVFESSDKVTDFIQEVLKTINGVLRIDRATGKVQIKLLRADYDPADLLTFDTTNVLEISNVKRTALSECVNQVTCKYVNYKTGEQASLVLQDLALMQAQGETINADFDYKYVYWADTANKLAQRDLYEASSQFFSCKLQVGLVGRFLNLGDCIKLNFPHLGIENLVFRVLKITYGGSASNEITIDLMQDKFYMPNTLGYTQSQSDIPSPIATTGITYSRIIETPYYLLHKFGVDVDSMLTDTSSNGGKAGFLVSSWDTLKIDGVVQFYGGDSGWTNIGNMSKNDFVSTCVLANNVDILDGTLQYVRASQLSKVNSSYIGFLDDEIIGIGEIDNVNSEIYIARGLFDTVPTTHTAGSVIYFVAMTDTGIINANTMLNVPHEFRLPYTKGNETQDLNETSVQSITFDRRCYRPYPVACLKCYNEFFPPFKKYDMYYNSSLTWKARNRLTQLTDTYLPWISTDNVTAESGIYYEIVMTNESETIQYTYTTQDLSTTQAIPCDIEQYAKIKMRTYRYENGSYVYSQQAVVMEGALQDIVLEFGINSYATLTLKKNSNYPISASIVDGELVIELNDSFHTTFEVDEDNNLYRVIER